MKKSFGKKAGGIMFRGLKRLCMAIGAMFLISMLISITMTSMLTKNAGAPKLPDKMVLHLSLEGSFADYSVPSPYSFVMRPHFRHLIDSLDHAQSDDRIKGILITPGGGATISLAQMQELRSAIKRFRATTKPVWFYAETMDGGMGAYYLASASEQIWLQPVGTITVPGIRAELPYARDLLKKLGVEPQFFARKEYKDVFGSFAETRMNDRTRESLTKVLDDVSGVMIKDIASDRNVSDAQLRQSIDKAVLTDQEALKAGLIDRLDYFDTLKKEIREKILGSDDPKGLKFVKWERYVSDQQQHAKKVPQISKHGEIALVYVVGAIVSDTVSSSTSFYGESAASAEDLAKDIDAITRDDDIKAIVVRIDSPGGSPTASETIRRSLAHAQEKGKKVVVSMGGTAASGGYWIASTADYIFAMPMTITGSIGVAGGKFVMQELWQKIGVNWDHVSVGDNSDIYSSQTPYTAQGRERMNAIMDSIYDAFIQRVAEGRKKSIEEVDKVARGRVWTGQSARDLGLIDDWGTLNEALDYAAVLAGMKSRRDATIIEYPKQKTAFEKLIELLEMQAHAGRGLSALADIYSTFVPLKANLSTGGVEARERFSFQ